MKRVSLNTELTILKQVLIHGKTWEFKGQALYRMIQRLKFLTPTSAISNSNTLNYEKIDFKVKKLLISKSPL